MSPRLQQRLVLILFWILGPLTTFVVVASVGVRHTTWAARFYEDALGREIGRDVTIRRVEFVRPDTVRLHGVAFGETVSKTPRLFFPEMLIEDVVIDTDDAIDRFFPALASDAGIVKPTRFYRLHAPLLVWNAASGETSPLEAILAYWGRVDVPPAVATPIQIGIDEMRVVRETPHTKPVTVKLTSLQARSCRTSSAHHLDGRFTTAGDAASESVFWSVVHSLDPAATLRSAIELATTPSSPIPMPLLAIFAPSLDIAGNESRFVGTLRGELMWEPDPQRYLWSLFLKEVTVRNIPLESLARQFTHYRVSGTIEGVCLDEAHWREGLVSAKGWLHLTQGVLDAELVARLTAQLRLRTIPDDLASRVSGGVVPFEQFGLRYQLSRRGATFEAPGENGIIMQDATRTLSLVIPPAMQPTPYSEILSVLTPSTAPQVPWTPQTKQALQILPTEPTSRN